MKIRKNIRRNKTHDLFKSYTQNSQMRPRNNKQKEIQSRTYPLVWYIKSTFGKKLSNFTFKFQPKTSFLDTILIVYIANLQIDNILTR